MLEIQGGYVPNFLALLVGLILSVSHSQKDNSLSYMYTIGQDSLGVKLKSSVCFHLALLVHTIHVKLNIQMLALCEQLCQDCHFDTLN